MFTFKWSLNIFVFQVDKQLYLFIDIKNSKRCSNTKKLFIYFTQFFKRC
jgi:hypothetical protein